MQWALVTGASAGIGAELAKQFAARGISVVLVARRRARLDELAAALNLRHRSVQVEVIDQDLASPGGVAKLVGRLAERGFAIDYLVNNAGFGSSGEFHKLKLERELEMIDLNVRALSELTRRLLPAMVERGFGRVLNVGSIAGFLPGPYMATYYASKAFVNSFSQALNEELRGTGVTVTVLAPGPVATEFGEVATPGRKLPLFASGVASAESVARYGLEALLKGRALAVPGCRFRILIQALRLAPRGLAPRISARLNRPRG